ncbi:hypothetical protein EDD63_11532 [Breznakia blatticola]|uniref:DUF5050 domain-containing protein n=1 Tax=Breznakia blatticola TaxID=1754012 RepID=A0A4V3G7R3_9FIRM|nr:hypothetical protein [Breznakia blatticola]TDW20074.1 hypothetical protein EDD63_11532 [Breznakia blatticola]
MIQVLDVNNDYIFYCVRSENESLINVEYILYDFDKNNSSSVRNEKVDRENFDTPGGVIHNNELYFILPVIEGGQLICYDTKSDEYSVLLKGVIHESFTILNDELYYILIDNVEMNTELNKINLKSKKSKFLASQNYNDDQQFINQLFNDGKKVYILVDSSSDYSAVYSLDEKNNTINELFKTDYMGTVSMVKDSIYWNGKATLPGRSRLQYYIYNTNTNEEIVFKGNQITANNSDVCWIEFIDEENEAPYGYGFSSEYARTLCGHQVDSKE